MTPVRGWRIGADQRGSVTAWLMVVPLILLLLCGATLDLWVALSARGRVAAIADQAAVVGAGAVADALVRDGQTAVGLDPEQAVSRALEAVDAHPERHAVTHRTAWATPGLVSVTVEGTSPFLLLRIIGVDAAPVRVTGHAVPLTPQ